MTVERTAEKLAAATGLKSATAPAWAMIRLALALLGLDTAADAYVTSRLPRLYVWVSVALKDLRLKDPERLDGV